MSVNLVTPAYNHKIKKKLSTATRYAQKKCNTTKTTKQESRAIDTMDDDCKPQIDPSVALRLQQLTTHDGLLGWQLLCGLTLKLNRGSYWYMHTSCIWNHERDRGVWGGSEFWMHKLGNRISGDNFLIVFHSKYGSILLSFQDMTKAQTTDRRTDDGPMSATIPYLTLNAGH